MAAPFVLCEDGSWLTLDLGNSLSLQNPERDPPLTTTLRVVIQAASGEIVLPAVPTVTSASYATGVWIFDVPLTAEQFALAATNPIGIRTGDASNTLVLAEAPDGRYVNNEPLSLRLDPGQSGQVTVYATQFGRPLANLTLPFGFDNPPFSRDNQPRAAVQFAPQVQLDANGTGTVRITASRPDPLPDERVFAQSQVYFLGGDWENWGQIGQSPVAAAGAAVTVLVFEDGPVVPSPTWSDVGPVLNQYARLYPAMKARLDLSSYQAVKDRRDEILHVIGLPFNDPAAMPVTRDLSAYRRRMIQMWIANGCPE
jgi:hypothetical protein